MFKLEDFHKDFVQNIFAASEGNSLGNNEAFFQIVCDELIETGELPANCTYAYFNSVVGRFTLETSGYAFDEERKILFLITTNLFQNDEIIQTLTTKSAEQLFKRSHNFIFKTFTKIYTSLEETSDGFEMAQFLYNKFNNDEISKINILLLTDGQVSRSYKEVKLNTIAGISVETNVIDVEYLYNNFTAKNSDSSFVVDVKLPVLQIPTNSNQYKSYLTYISGNQIYDIYDHYGKKILEQNVRTFLQFKGNVNKGIKNSIKDVPEMFFAYNNGITATASDIEFNSKNEIIAIHNLQIVNGGQTTSAIYASKKSNKIDISKISVQMKLSVIKQDEHHSEFVSRVAEYANTQNKVNKSDFFSNSPFHKEYKKYSESTWVPALTKGRHKWFYERVRGEYLNEQAYMTKTNKNKFETMYPKKNKIEKTFLAKTEIAWKQKPYIVSKGAQYSFIAFAEFITYEIEKDSLLISQDYFKNTVSRMILFKKLEAIVSRSTWFNGGYRANIVAYSLSYISYYLTSNNKKSYLNFNEIWKIQDIPSDIVTQLEILTEQVFKHIISPPAGFGNPAQWAKKEDCWIKLKQKNIEFTLPNKYIISNQEQQVILQETKKNKMLDKGIEQQTFVITFHPENWRKIYEYYSTPSNRGTLSVTSYSILERFVNGKMIPTEKQSAVLYTVYKKAVDEGMHFSK